MSIECGSKEAAEVVAAHFERLPITLLSGSQSVCEASLHFWEKTWWVCVCPEGVSTSGVYNEKDAQELTMVGKQLFDRLRSAPPFRYAMVGVEVDCFRSYDELDSSLADPFFDGLVLEDSLWRQIGSPENFVKFSEGYHWQPFIRAK